MQSKCNKKYVKLFQTISLVFSKHSHIRNTVFTFLRCEGHRLRICLWITILLHHQTLYFLNKNWWNKIHQIISRINSPLYYKATVCLKPEVIRCKNECRHEEQYICSKNNHHENVRSMYLRKKSSYWYTYSTPSVTRINKKLIV